MKTFRCHCGNVLNFENSLCLSCNRELGYLPDERQLSAIEPAGKGNWQALYNNQSYRRCKNYSEHDVCNWMVPVGDPQPFCTSCRLNHIIPNLDKAQNIILWYRMESAKRRLLYTLFSLNLPVVGRAEDPNKGLAFNFLQDEVGPAGFSNELTILQTVSTGHSNGTITINLLEAEHSSREEMREKMNEGYRTLLGHFRHESGHYYWDRLVKGTENITSFRELFGDEQLDYKIALNNYYAQGAPLNWQNTWISAYASSHPWEDWAETWAHYLHMVDTLETAHDFGFQIHGIHVSDPNLDGQMMSGYMAPASFEALFNDWGRLTNAHNSLNRSMGMKDAYPFVISITALRKLHYVHRIVKDAGRSVS